MFTNINDNDRKLGVETYFTITVLGRFYNYSLPILLAAFSKR